MKRLRFIYCLLFYTCRFTGLCLAVIVSTLLYAQSNEKVKANEIPTALTHRLDSLRAANNLEEWLYSCMDYVQENPSERIEWLTEAQTLAWRGCRNKYERLAWLYFLAMQGYYQLYNGNILRSIKAYEQAYRFYFEQPVPQANVVEYVLKPLGNNYTRLGDYDQAYFIQEKSLQLAAQQNDRQQTAGVYNNLAITARWKGEWENAKFYADKGLQTVEKNTPLHGLLLSTKADILFQQHELAEADKMIKAALRILRLPTNENKDNAFYWLLSAYHTQGTISQEKNEPLAALEFYRKANKILHDVFQGKRKREQAKLWVSMGDAWLKLNRPQQAIGRYNAAIAVLTGQDVSPTDKVPEKALLYGENTLLDALKGKAECLLVQHKNEEALSYFMLLFDVQRKLRHEFFSSEAKEQQQKEDRAWIEKAMDSAFELWQFTGQKKYARILLLVAELSKAQLLLDDLKQNLRNHRLQSGDTLLGKQWQAMQAVAWYERETILHEEAQMHNLKLRNAKKEATYQLSLIQKEVKAKYGIQEQYYLQGNQSDAEALLNSIPAETIVAEYFMGEKKAYLILAEKDEVLTIVKLTGTDALKQKLKNFVATYFQNGVDALMQHPEQYYKEAYAIGSELCRPLLQQKAKRYLLIPDGEIGNIPFDALITDSLFRPDIDQWAFLIKKINLFYAYSLQAWQQQQRIQHVHTLFAGFFISFDSGTHTSLPAVRKEYQMLQQQVQGKFYLEQEASLPSFQKVLQQVNILHISTHSFVQGRERTPVLQLYPEPFFLFQLYGQTFQPQLVVLSACRTAQGMLAEGEGIISLARGFTAAGSGGILASQWNMNDESTAELIGKFYYQLKKTHNPADALHRAKLQWLQQPNNNDINKLPYFWAGIIYMGGDRAIPIQSPAVAPSLLVWIGSMLLIGVLAIILLKIKRKKRGALC